MQINLRENTILPILMSMLLVVQQTISFTVFSFLQPLSYMALGLILLSFVFMVGLFCLRPYASLFDLSCFAFFLLLVTFTVIGAADIKNSIYQFCTLGLLFLLFNYYGHKSQLLIKSMAFAFSCCIYLNMLLMILYPNWMFMAEDTQDCFLLGGNYNQMGPRFLVAIVLCSLCTEYNWKWRINYIVIVVVSIVTLVIVNSMTSFAAIFVFVTLSLIPSLQLRKYAAVSMFVVYVLFQLFVVFSGNSLHNNELAVYIVEDLLGKDMTFTHRTDMWDQSWNYFVKSPLIGYGLLDSDWYREHMVVYGIGPHNYIYALMLYGGIVLPIVFFVCVFLAFKSVVRCFDRHAMKIILGIVTILFMMLMEVYAFFFIFLLLTLAAHYDDLKPSLNINNND